MQDMDPYLSLLANAANELNGTADVDPDGLAARQVLLLAAHAGTGQPGAAHADWDLYTATVIDAAQRLQADLDEPVLLVEGLPAPGPDSPALRQAVTGALRRLADLHGAAAAGDRGTAWRRLVWGQVAHRLDDAVAELTGAG